MEKEKKRAENSGDLQAQGLSHTMCFPGAAV
jgi:hypothetical protein